MENNQPNLSKDDIAPLFKSAKSLPPKKPLLRKILNEAIFVVVVFIASFVVVNWPAISQNLRYWWKVDFRNQPTINSTVKISPPAAKIAPTTQSRLIIPRIGVDAPIIWDINYADIHSQLSNGVVHYAGTAHPDEVGNTFLVGHSSDYVWSTGHYKQIFSLIDKLVAGDQITIYYQGLIYNYQVSDSLIVKPTATEVLNPTSKPTLTLMTCYPVGTTLNRLVVKADLISPTINQLPQATPKLNTLPPIR